MWKCKAIFLLPLFFVKVFSLSEELEELINTLHNSCVQETGASEDAINNARKGHFPQDQKLACYMKCILEQMGCIDDSGTIDVDAVIALLPEEFQDKAEGIMKPCGTKVGANHCENAYLTNQCWYQQAPNDYFLV